MTAVDVAAVNPDTAQSEIIQNACGSRQLILAGPGTGKTFVLIERLNYLVTQKVVPGTIVVLSYTRAAVREIRDRLRTESGTGAAHPDTRLVEIRTFDSFASSLLNAAGADLTALAGSYDDRIRLFTETLTDGRGQVAGRLRDYVRRIRHLIVDEIQDLVGLRARLVVALLESASWGFTLLGDPNQSIYDYQTEEQGQPTADRFLAWLRAYPWASPLVEKTLERNYRQEASLQQLSRRLVEVVAQAVGGAKSTNPYESALQIVKVLPLAKLSAARPATPSNGQSPGFGDGSCILCRTNGEALDVMAVLAGSGIPFHYQAAAEERALPAWIGRVFGGYGSRTMDADSFTETYTRDVGEASGSSASEAWAVLKRVEQQDSDSLDLERLKANLRWSFPDELCAHEQNRKGVCISTIHKAKGRQFDHVHLLVPSRGHPEASLNEEARVVYVAVTRARSAVDRLQRNARSYLTQGQNDGSTETGRWLAMRDHKVYAYEVGQPGDVDVMGPVNLYLFPNTKDVRACQDYIWQQVQVGDPVLISKYVRGRYVFYNTLHRDQSAGWHVIGQMSQAFRSAVHTQLKTHPRRFKFARVVAKATEICQGWPDGRYDPAFLKAGLWLNVRLRGLGIVEF